MKNLGVFMLAVIALTLVGCSHSLEIKNLSQYQSTSLNTQSKELTMGIMSSRTDSDGKVLVTGTAEALSEYMGQVIYPYETSNSTAVDIVAKIVVRSDHKGSGYNFWINFPGFLIWTPAWNGYIYEPSYTVDVNMVKADDNSTIDSFTIPIKLDVRHAAINRTWTEISWFEVGIIAFISGFVFMNYDDGVTPLVGAAIKKPIGDYIAQEMTSRLRNSNKLNEMLQKRKAKKLSSLELLRN